MGKEWKNISQLFDVLNKAENYVVLRNYEELMDEVYNKEHPDIDFLCQNAVSFRRHAKSISRGKPWDRIHHKIFVDGKEISIDIRELGDGYYDSAWEQRILNNRILYRESFFVPSPEDYFYSLLYHALIHKTSMSTDYYERLEKMRLQLNIPVDTVSLNALEGYMANKGYKYTFPANPKGIFNIKDADAALIEKNTRRRMTHFTFLMMSKVKRRISSWVN